MRRLDRQWRLAWVLVYALLVVATEAFLRRPNFSLLDHAGSWSVLYMGKGDGKKKRKKKDKSVPSSPSASTDPAPLRVTNNINVPVRHQIRMAQLNKEAARQSSPSFRQKRVERTRYRRTWDEEEIEAKAEERRRKGQEPDWDVILNRTAAMPLAIVDGYNIIYKWPRLKKHMAKGDLQRARQLLIDDLEDLRSLKGWRIEVVFDGTRRSLVGPLGSGPGGKATPTPQDRMARKDVSKFGVRTVFTGVGIEADSYIERRCADAEEVTNGMMTSSFIVISDDGMIRLAGQSAGALCMSADRFIIELKAIKKSVADRVETAVARLNDAAQPIAPQATQAGTYIHTYGRGSVLIEDKRKMKEERKRLKQEKEEALEELNKEIDEEEIEGMQNLWAPALNQTRPYK